MEQRFDRGPGVEDTIHGSFSRFNLSHDGEIQDTMGKRRIELCFRVSQV